MNPTTSTTSVTDGTASAAVVDEAFVLGGNVFGWTADAAESFAVLDAFVEDGGRMIDTADVYSAWVPGNAGGESEEIIGRWLASRGHRDRVQIATKVGRHPNAQGLTRTAIRTGLEASLRRLNTDYLDVYCAHFDDPDTPLEETLAAFDELVREGVVRHLAASNYPPERLREAFDLCEAHGWARFELVQAHYNLVRREKFETQLRPLLLERGVAALPYYSLAQGFLTGKYRQADNAERGVRSSAALRYLNERGRRVLDTLDGIADAHRVPVAAVALAWLRAQPAVAAPLASARTPRQLADLNAARTLRLTPEELTALDDASSWTR
ncbi:aldo/keto reductase [Saccharomonospora azurea]|uniref:aldo/keto reductase n=1 Tax=Saccharomonospora azurea TaxID=40988 RepID=UPI003327CBB6